MADIKISELSSAAILQDADNLELSQDISGTLQSTKVNLLSLGKKIASAINYTSELKTADKTLTGAINEKVGWVENAILGAKNLNATPYYHSSGRVQNYVTWTVNDDGSITANGTASGGNSAFSCHTRTKTNANCLILPNGKYIFSGCPSGGSTSKYALLVERTYNGTAETLGIDTGDGVEITLNGDDYSNDEVVVQIICRVYNGFQASNLTFYPMVRLANDTDATWKPYAETNKELTDNKVSWVENGLIGAKNLLPYPFYETSHTENGVTFTDNGDGSVTIVTNGASTGAARFNLYGGQGNSNLLPNIFVGMRGSMKYSTGSYNSNVYIYCQPFTADYSAHDNINDTDGTGWIVTNRALIRVAIYVASGTTLNTPITVYPMLRIPNDSDDTWQPYAPTNRDLQLTKPNPDAIATVEYSPTRANHSQGDLIMYNGNLYKCLSAITSGSTLTVGTNIQATNVTSEMGSAGWTDVTGTLTGGTTSVTLSDASITTSSTIDVYTDIFGVNPTSVSVVTGSVTLTFEARYFDLGVKVRVS